MRRRFRPPLSHICHLDSVLNRCNGEGTKGIGIETSSLLYNFQVAGWTYDAFRDALDADGKSPTQIQRAVGVSRPTTYKCIDKALAVGVVSGLRDRYHRAHAPQIREAAKVWVVDLACRKPKDVRLAAELWTISALAGYVAAHVGDVGFARLSQAGKSTVWRILDAHELKPHRVGYYLERRDAHASLDELRQQILEGIEEMSAHPVRFQWKNFDFQMT
ncbi:hypothetical protein NB231_10994 [Nitrococcus mobilis Nb-231]|uniref:Uncharacterized protein n=1 Tax=Nitrococcus mobilis Nb-231 TaxID=314278 RepID=A4BTX7_9GAMM|nr:hypothetical protein NB231_10994 [Nitrococcus mobilis Nb-231]